LFVKKLNKQPMFFSYAKLKVRFRLRSQNRIASAAVLSNLSIGCVKMPEGITVKVEHFVYDCSHMGA